MSFLIILIALPIFMLAAILIKLNSPGPIFFYQERIGLSEKRFNLIKLRTMTINPNRQINQTTNADPEVFWAGKILRRLKIDELPQIFNVIKGDMSIVGPRPCLELTLNRMPIWAHERFSVRPGLTGLAQINGNIALTWEERWKHDIKYVSDVSLIRDLYIILRTVLVVIQGEESFRKTL